MSDAAMAPDVTPAPGRRRGPLVVVAVVAVVAVLVLAGAAVAAYRALSGGGTQPEDVAPGTTFAFAKVDLDPAAGQKIAAYRFLRKFPDTPATRASSADDLRNQVLKAIVESSGGKLDYERDVKPWIGDRAGVAAFTRSDGSPDVVVLIQASDVSKAEQTLRKVDDGRIGVAARDGYVMVGPDQAAVDDAARQSDQAVLADKATFAGDIDALPGDQIAVGWVDAAPAAKALKQVAATDTGLFAGILPGLTGEFARSASGASGRAALGVHLNADYAELDARVFGAKQTAQPSATVSEQVAGLPADTVAAFGISSPDTLVRRLFDTLDKSPISGFFIQGADAVSAETGLKLPDDLAALLGSAAALSLGNDPSTGAAPLVALITHPAQPAAARSVADRLARYAGAQGLPLTVRESGGELVLASDSGYAGRVAGGGQAARLGDADLFRTAVGDLPGRVSAVGFVDLRPFLARSHDPQARPLHAVGLVAGADGDVQELRLRVVVG